MKELEEKLQRRTNKNWKKFMEEETQKDTKEVFTDGYKISVITEMKNFLMSDAPVHRLNKKIIKWLAYQNEPLDFLWEEWLSCDLPWSEDWNELIDWIENLYQEIGEDVEKTYKFRLCFGDGKWADGFYEVEALYYEEAVDKLAEEVALKLHEAFPQLNIEISWERID